MLVSAGLKQVNIMTEQLKSPRKMIHHPILRPLVLALGWVSTALGVAGMFLPVLPTTPFLLLAAACFIRTSPKFYNWLVAHPKLGRYLVYYLDGKGVPLKAKIYTLLVLWGSIILTAFVLLNSFYVRCILPLIGLGVSVYIYSLPTLQLEKPSKKSE